MSHGRESRASSDHFVVSQSNHHLGAARHESLDGGGRGPTECSPATDASRAYVMHLVWTARPDGTTDFVNDFRPAGKQQRDDFCEWGWLRLLHPDDVRQAREIWEYSVRTGAPYSNEYRVLQEDGAYRWYASQATAVCDSDGNIQKWIGTWTDIDDLKMAQLRAQRSDVLLANVRDSIVVTDLDFVITYWNSGAERVFGWAADEVVGHSALRRYPSEIHERLGEGMRQIVDGKDFSGEFEDYRKDGSRVWIDVRVTALRDEHGQVIGMISVCHDVSERKQFELERERLNAIVEASPHFVGLADADQRWVYVNRAGRELVGLADATASEVCGMPMCDFFSDADWTRVLVEVIPALHRKSRWEGEINLRHFKTGRQIPVHWKPFKLGTSDGHLPYIACIAEDLTEVQANLASIRASEERFRVFMAHSPLGAWITDAEGRLTYMSERLLSDYPNLSQEALGKTAWDLHPPDLAQDYSSKIEKVARTGKSLSGMERGPRLDGSIGQHLVCRFPILEADGSVSVGGVAFDVTSQLETEEALRLRDRAIQAVSQGIIITDAQFPDNPIVYASPGFCRLTGYEAEEVLGRNCRFLQGPATTEESRSEIRQAIIEVRPATIEIINYRKDGSQFWNELSISPVISDLEQLTHFVGVQTDVTQRKQLEEQYLQSQRMEAVGQLAGGIAHDFNNLLTVITAYSDSLLSADLPREQLVEGLAEITKAASRAAELTRQLLAFSRNEQVALEVIDLNDVIADMQFMLHRVIGEHIEISSDLSPDLYPILANPNQMAQVVLNLTINARDAMPNGGQLHLETRNVTLGQVREQGLEHVQPGEYALLSVSDSGHGIDDKLKDRIFEPFFSTKGPGLGTGLGLSVVHGVVLQSQGFLAVKGRLGRGTVFEVYLPRSHRASNEISESPLNQSHARGSESILLVEDQEGVRRIGRQILEKCGYYVVEAADALEALAFARESPRPFDLLLTDVIMPKMGGQRLAEVLTSEFPEMKVIFVSGYVENLKFESAKFSENPSWLAKPFSARELTECVAKALGEKVIVSAQPQH